MELLYTDESYAIRGAVFEVYREMGNGYLEAVYQECLERELHRRSIPYEPRPALTLHYKGEPLTRRFQPDLVCYGKILIELKAVKDLCPDHRAQMINYLKATGLKLGFLVNFGSVDQVQIERLIL